MNQLPQTQCPHCQAAIYWYSPGCFNCRQPIQWPAPQTSEQASLQQASIAYFQQILAQYQNAAAQQQAQSASQPATAPETPARPSPPTVAAAGWDGTFETTRHDAVRYDPNAAEDVEGLDSGNYGDLVPKNLPTSVVEDLLTTAVQDNAPGLGITGNEPDVMEATRFDDVQVQPGSVEDFDAGSYAAVTESVRPDGADPEVERTAIDDAPPRPTTRAQPKRQKGGGDGMTTICNSCGTLGRGQSRCVACGAATKPIE